MMWGAPNFDRRGSIWVDVVNQYALRVLNDGQPTRLDEATGEVSHIDLTLASSDIASLIEWNTEKDLHSSDHFPIYLTMNNMRIPATDLPPLFTGWNTRRANWTEFQEWCDFRFDPDMGIENCDLLTQQIIESAKLFIPCRNGNGKYKCPWWTDECKEALKERKRAQNRMRRDPYSLFLRIEYRKQKAKTRQILRSAQVNSWHELLSVFNHRTPVNRLWEILRRFTNKTRISKPFPVLINNGQVVDEHVEVANTFAQFFADLSSRSNYPESFLRHERVLADTLPDFGNDNVEDYNEPFTIRELMQAINRSGSTSVGPDMIHYDFFRHLQDQQIAELLALYNYIWTNDTLPESWRHSYIIPVLKPGKDCSQVSSYRPIQLTSCMCKVLERMVAKRMSWYIEKYELLSEHQCAFRRGKSTVDHLVRIDSHVRDGFLHHDSTLGVFLDIKSAYNMVSPNVLLHRMHHIGFRGHLMQFVKNYLTNRTFQVRCGALSDVFRQDYGVVQGGVISPLLFNIAIDSLIDVVPSNISIAVYADDCTIWTQGKRIPNLFQEIQQALTKIGHWALTNGFTFSAAKSKAILFRRGRKRLNPATLPTLKLSNERILLDEQVKYLGVILDARLNLSSHMEYMKGKALKRMAVLKSVAGKRFGADRTVLLRMYSSLVRPILDYGSHILDGPGNRRSKSLEPIQNSCLRIAAGALRTSPVRALQVETNVPPLEIRRQELLIRYYLKVRGDKQHQCHNMMNHVTEDRTYEDLSERYLQRVAGLPIVYRLRKTFLDWNYEPPEVTANTEGTIPPWKLADVHTIKVMSDKNKATDIDIQTEFHDITDRFPGHRLFFTDGSKMNNSVGCAFTLNNAFFSFRLPAYVTVYTAELFAILAAIEYIRENRVVKALICTDSLSAVNAMASQNRDHPILVSIMELYHMNQRNVQCSILWVPGHKGISGNVRADYWARRAHLKPNITPIKVGYREYIPQLKRSAVEAFARLWREYRQTQLKLIKPSTGKWYSSVRHNRQEEVVLCRMRLGHTVMTHSHIMDRIPAPICDRCGVQLDIQHMLLDCRKFIMARQSMSFIFRTAGVPMNMGTLLGNVNIAILDALFLFLRECDLFDKL